MTVDKELLDILVCPSCHGELQYGTEPEQFVCTKCGKRYAVVDGIPDMLIDHADGADGDR
jgi:uncharacterized protein